MLINKFIYFLILVPIFTIVFYLIMRYQTFKNKNEEWRKENLKNIVIGATVLFTFISYMSIETVYLVKDDGYKIFTIIGPLNYEYQNGEKARIKKDEKTIIINDSKQILTLESVDYGRGFSHNGDKFQFSIQPFGYCFSDIEIHYTFDYNSPPEKIKVQGYGGYERRYWLHR